MMKGETVVSVITGNEYLVLSDPTYVPAVSHFFIMAEDTETYDICFIDPTTVVRKVNIQQEV